MEDLEEYWHPLVPRTFPHGGDLHRRVPVPVFFAMDDHSVAVHAAGGVTGIADAAQAAFLSLDVKPDGLGILIDADFGRRPAQTWRRVSRSLAGIDVGSGPGVLGGGDPRAGIFVLPDNRTAGTAEDLLLKCAQKAYPNLLASAADWIDALDPGDVTTFARKRDREELTKPAGRTKAKVGAIANVLRPGKAVQVSLQDNDWLRHPDALALPEVQALQAFVDAVAGIAAAGEKRTER